MDTKKTLGENVDALKDKVLDTAHNIKEGVGKKVDQVSDEAQIKKAEALKKIHEA